MKFNEYVASAKDKETTIDTDIIMIEDSVDGELKRHKLGNSVNMMLNSINQQQTTITQSITTAVDDAVADSLDQISAAKDQRLIDLGL